VDEEEEEDEVDEVDEVDEDIAEMDNVEPGTLAIFFFGFIGSFSFFRVFFFCRFLFGCFASGAI
jgi:hypothetical protein